MFGQKADGAMLSARHPSIVAIDADYPDKCDNLTLQFLIIRNIHLKNKKNVAKIANKGLLGEN